MCVDEKALFKFNQRRLIRRYSNLIIYIFSSIEIEASDVGLNISVTGRTHSSLPFSPWMCACLFVIGSINIYRSICIYLYVKIRLLFRRGIQFKWMLHRPLVRKRLSWWGWWGWKKQLRFVFSLSLSSLSLHLSPSLLCQLKDEVLISSSDHHHHHHQNADPLFGSSPWVRSLRYVDVNIEVQFRIVCIILQLKQES